MHMFICPDSYTAGQRDVHLLWNHNFIFEEVGPSYKICPIAQLWNQRNQSQCPNCRIKETKASGYVFCIENNLVLTLIGKFQAYL